ncbi:tyrosine-type recombinase/integrase [Longicatena caecimuris]|uniref:tyrosine-type recombinase/integrase n=1 Tax=Longicatena caecimuris TaxID=1796635 RepID=UPI0018AA7879|nr:tyrosine-type recombinase/integrase [Longicatena caecimuris]
MSVYKRNGKWYIQGNIKKEDDTYYRYTKLARNCKYVNEAREYEIEFIKQWQAIQVAKYNKSFSVLATEYLKHASDNVKAVTLRTDEDIIDKCNKVFGDKKINLFTKDYLQSFIKDLEKKYSKSYVSKYYYTISKIFKYAVINEYILTNPMERVRKSAYKDEVKQEMQFWEPEEFNTFIEYVTNSEIKRFFIFLYYMGTRKGETQALQWKDIDLKNDTVKINKTITNKIKGKAWEITSPKTQNSIRNITMPDIVKQALVEQKQYVQELEGFNDNCFVFGFFRPLPSETIRKNLIRTVKLANEDGHNLKQIRIHDFRHSHVSYLINNKSNTYTDFDIANRLGDTVKTIQETYAHWFRGADKKIIDFINEDTKENNIPKQSDATTNKYSELKELKELLDMGIITDFEFNTKKKQILGI